MHDVGACRNMRWLCWMGGLIKQTFVINLYFRFDILLDWSDNWVIPWAHVDVSSITACGNRADSFACCHLPTLHAQFHSSADGICMVYILVYRFLDILGRRSSSSSSSSHRDLDGLSTVEWHERYVFQMRLQRLSFAAACRVFATLWSKSSIEQHLLWMNVFVRACLLSLTTIIVLGRPSCHKSCKNPAHITTPTIYTYRHTY